MLLNYYLINNQRHISRFTESLLEVMLFATNKRNLATFLILHGQIFSVIFLKADVISYKPCHFLGTGQFVLFALSVLVKMLDKVKYHFKITNLWLCSVGVNCRTSSTVSFRNLCVGPGTLRLSRRALCLSCRAVCLSRRAVCLSRRAVCLSRRAVCISHRFLCLSHRALCLSLGTLTCVRACSFLSLATLDCFGQVILWHACSLKITTLLLI